jgi:hypothetical protein
MCDPNGYYSGFVPPPRLRVPDWVICDDCNGLFHVTEISDGLCVDCKQEKEKEE